MKNGTMQTGPKVAIGVTIHNLMAKIPLGGVGRCYLWKKSLEIYCQRRIYDKKWREWSDLNSKPPINWACWSAKEKFAF